MTLHSGNVLGREACLQRPGGHPQPDSTGSVGAQQAHLPLQCQAYVAMHLHSRSCTSKVREYQVAPV